MKVENQCCNKRNSLAKVITFCHVICSYFGRFLLQGVNRNWRQSAFYYLAPSLICEGCQLVNSQRSIFHIADPTIVYRTIARLNKLVGHKSYIVRADCFNRVFDCSISVYRSENYGWPWALPRPNLATPLYGIRV